MVSQADSNVGSARKTLVDELVAFNRALAIRWRACTRASSGDHVGPVEETGAAIDATVVVAGVVVVDVDVTVVEEAELCTERLIVLGG